MSSAAEKFKAQRLSQLSRNSTFLITNGLNNSGVMADEDEENLIGKVKKKSDKRLYDEDIIDGFSFLSFESYQDIEETFKPFLKARVENQNHAVEIKKKMPKPRNQNRVPKASKKRGESGPASPRERQLNFDGSSDVSQPGSSFGEQMVDASESEDTCDNTIEFAAPQIEKVEGQSLRNSFEVGPSSLPAVLSPVAPVPSQEKPPSPLPGTTVTAEQFSEVISPHQEPSQTPSSSVPPPAPTPKATPQRQPPVENATAAPVPQPPVEPPMAHSSHVDQKYPPYTQGYSAPQMPSSGFSQLHRFPMPGSNQTYQPPSFAVPGEKAGIKQPYPPSAGQNYYADPALSRPDPTLSHPEASQQTSVPLSLTVRQETDAHNYTIQNLVKHERCSSGPNPESDPQKFSAHKPEFYSRMCEPFRPFENHKPSEHQKPPVSGRYSMHRNSEPVKSDTPSGIQKPAEASHSFSHYRPYDLHKSESHKPTLYKPEFAVESYPNRDASGKPVQMADNISQRPDNNHAYRPDLAPSYRLENSHGPSSSYKPVSNQGPSYRLEGPSYKPETNQGQSLRPEASQLSNYRPESNQVPIYRPENNQGPSYRPENNQGPVYRPDSNQGLNYRPENNPGLNYRSENNQGPTYRPESTQGSNYRPESNQGPNYRPENNQVPNYRPDSGHGQNFAPRLDSLQKTSGNFNTDNLYKQENMFKQESPHHKQMAQRQEVEPRNVSDLRYGAGYTDPSFGSNQRSETGGRVEMQQSMQGRGSADKTWTEPQNLSVGGGRSVTSSSSSNQPSGPSEPPWKQDFEISSEQMKIPFNNPAQVPYPPKPANHNPVSSTPSSVAAAHPFSMSKLVGNYPTMSQPEDLSRIPNGYNPPASQSYSYQPGFPQYSSHPTHSPQSVPIPKSGDSGPNFFRPITSPKPNPYPTPPISGQASFGGDLISSGRSEFSSSEVTRREEARLKPPSPSPRSKQQMLTNVRSSSSSSPQISALPRPAVLESPSFKSVSKPNALQPSPSVPFSPNYPTGIGSLHGGPSSLKKDYGDLRQSTIDASVPSSLPGSALYSSGHSHFSKVEGPESLPRITPGANFGRIEPIPPYQPFFPPGGEMSSFNCVSQTGPTPFPPPPAVKKPGRWNSMHVKLAWEIFHHQQRSRTVGDPKRTPFVVHSSVPNPGSILTAKAQQPSNSSLYPGLASKPLVDPPSQSFMPPPPQAAASFGIPSSMASPYNPYSLPSMGNGLVATQPQPTKATPTQSPSIDPWSRQHRTPPVSAGSGPQTPNWPPRSDSANSSSREKERERHRREEHRKSTHPLSHPPSHVSSERRRSHSRSPLHLEEPRLRNDISDPGSSRSDNFDLKSGRTSIDRMKPSDISTSKAASSVSSAYDPRTSVPSLPGIPTLPSVPSLQMSAPSLYPRDLGIGGLDRNLLQGLSGSYASVPSDPRLSALGLDPLQQAYLADREREAIMKLNASRYGLGLPPGLGYGMERFSSPGLDIRELERAKIAAAFGLGGSSLFGPQAGSSYAGLGLPPVSAASIPVSAYQGFSHYPKPPSATSFGYGPSGSAVQSMLPSVSRSSGLGLGLGSSMGLGSSSLNGLYPSGASTFLSPSLRAPGLHQSLGLSGYPGLSSMGVRHPSLGFPGLDGALNPLGPRPPF